MSSMVKEALGITSSNVRVKGLRSKMPGRAFDDDAGRAADTAKRAAAAANMRTTSDLSWRSRGSGMGGPNSLNAPVSPPVRADVNTAANSQPGLGGDVAADEPYRARRLRQLGIQIGPDAGANKVGQGPGPAFDMPDPSIRPSSSSTNNAITQVSSSGQPAGQTGGGMLSRGLEAMRGGLEAMRGGGAAISGAMGAGAANIGLTGAAAVAGGATSYATGGEFTQGAVAGGMLGAGLGMGGASMIRQGIGSGGEAASKALKGYGYDDAASNVGSFSSGMVDMLGSMTTKDSRRAAFGAGAMLGGYTFGGDKSHKRGFNSNRGNSFGR